MWVCSVDFGAKDGHHHVDDDEDIECDMADVELNIPPLYTNNSQTYVPTSSNETCLASQFKQLHLRIDWFENKVSSDIAQLSNQIYQLSAHHSELISFVCSFCPPQPPLA